MEPSTTVLGTSRTSGPAGTHVLDHGGPETGALLLLLHGFGGSALNWQLVGPRLAQRHRVVAVDLYAHGRSAAPEGLSADDVVTQVCAVIEAEQADVRRPVVLVAGSFGATMALLVARARPDLVDGIVVVDGALPLHPERRLDLTMTLKRWLISAPGMSGLIFRKTSAMTPREYVELQLSEAGVDHRRVDDGLLDVSVELERTRHGDRAAHESQQSLLRDLLTVFARGRAFTEMTAGVSVPVRWLHSDDDPLIGFELAREFVAGHPSWEFRGRAGLGHVPMITDPGWVVDEVLEWVAGRRLDGVPSDRG